MGVLWAHADPTRFRHARYLASADLAARVEHYWIVRWDLRGAPPFCQETLPHPSVHLVVEAGHSGVVGVPPGRFTKLLAGRGRAVGIKFRSGGFRSFWPAPVHTLSRRVVPLHDAFGPAGAALEAAVLDCAGSDPGHDPGPDPDDPGPHTGAGAARVAGPDRWPGAAAVDVAIVEQLELFLRVRQPPAASADPHAAPAALVAALIDRIVRERDLATVDAVARAGGVSARTVQRLFRDYVGVSAKWVLCRQRLHDAASQLAAGAPEAWTRLALDLGYYDQAHFVRSFTALVGVSPAAYVRRLHDHRAG